jgi:hypothetical protein
MSKPVSIHSTTLSNAFITYARLKALSKDSPANALALAEQMGNVDPQVTERYRKEVSNPGLTSNWGANLTDPINMAFIDATSNFGFFGQIEPAAHHIPFNTSAATVVTLGAHGSAVDEGSYKPVHELEVGSSGPLVMRKAAAIVVMSPETWRNSTPGGQSLVRRSLLSGTARVTDQEALSVISDGAVNAGSSSGSDVGSVLADFAALFGAVRIGQASRLFLVMSSENAKAIAFMGSDNGFAFEQMTPQGGSIQGVRVLVSDVADDRVFLIDASGLATSVGTVLLSSASHATVAMSATDSDEGWTSLWQKNLLGLRAERMFGCALVRDDAAAYVDGADYSGSV